MQHVFVLDKKGQPLMPCHPARARELLRKGKAAVHGHFPLTIILKERDGGDTQPVALKIDPGSKITGMSLVANQRVVWAGELHHRGQQIKAALESRRALRSARRQRKTRYRAARFNNRRRCEGWLPPSLQSRVENVMTWGARLSAFCPISRLSLELVRFDTQVLQNPEISGVEYQQGELQGYEVREYLLEKWGRQCAYCGAKNLPLEVEHITPKTRGGSNRVSNLTIACHDCNQRKGNRTAAEFGHPDVQRQAKQPLRDAAAINATRWGLYKRLVATRLPLEVGTGGRTKFNRIKQGYPKAHWIDAACVGESGAQIRLNAADLPLTIKATGRQSRQMCRVDKYGFPRTGAKSSRFAYGFQTGDRVKARVTTGKKVGTYIGRVAVRRTGSFNISTPTGTVQGIRYQHCTLIHQSDGYSYEKGVTSAFSPA